MEEEPTLVSRAQWERWLSERWRHIKKQLVTPEAVAVTPGARDIVVTFDLGDHCRLKLDGTNSPIKPEREGAVDAVAVIPSRERTRAPRTGCSCGSVCTHSARPRIADVPNVNTKSWVVLDAGEWVEQGREGAMPFLRLHRGRGKVRLNKGSMTLAGLMCYYKLL